MLKTPFYILLFPLLLLFVALAIVYPYYQYYVDPDAIGYMSVAQHYVNGDIQQAINGYWSPWSCWLTAGLMNWGYEPFKAGIIINSFGAGGFLIASHFLFKRFLTNKEVLLSLNTTLACFLVYAVFKQSFADLWFFFFLLVIFQLFIRENFFYEPSKWLLCGFLSTLAYFAKAYAFPYIFLSTIVILAVRMRLEMQSYSQTIKVTTVILGCFILFSFPWLWALHDKYGAWITATSGKLNLSWYLLGHPIYKEGIDLLIPPTYTHSIFFWEDPFYANGATPNFLSSTKLFLLQVIRVGYTLLKGIASMNELSAFFLPISLVGLVIILSKEIRQNFPKPFYLLAILFLLFPLGYLLINFESRYLWVLVPISLLLGAWLYEFYSPLIHSSFLRYLILGIFCCSYLATPIDEMKRLYRVGEKEYQLAQQLKAAPINGSFATNIPQSKEMQQVMRIAWFSGNSFYYMPIAPTSSQQLFRELERYKVRYFYMFQSSPLIGNMQFEKEQGLPYTPIFKDSTLLGLTVYQLY